MHNEVFKQFSALPLALHFQPSWPPWAVALVLVLRRRLGDAALFPFAAAGFPGARLSTN